MSARGPIEVQLAKAQDSVPPKSALVGGTIWELKYDGYRAPLRVTGQGAELWSRNGSNLSSHFPDLVAAAEAQLAAGVVLDGEAVVWLDGRLNFDQLQRRMVSRPAVAAKLAQEHPASYVAFDLLTLGEQDLRPHPWRDRRAALEDLASTWRPPLQLSPYTDDYDTALEWLVDYRVAGVEGLVAKGAGSPYRPGSRDWIKVRSRENLDVIVGAVIGPASRPEAVVAGRYTDTGELVIVGRTTALSTRQAKQLATVLTPAATGEHPWPPRIGSGHFDGGSLDITRVQPDVVVEVAADSALQAGRHRHPLRLLRLRPDLAADDIDTFAG
jgi:ATP-dependent DNA ligase